MAAVQALLRSRVLAALASPHGVDRYLELVNPMWAATDVRARVVSVHRENPDSDAAPVATVQKRADPSGSALFWFLVLVPFAGPKFTSCASSAHAH